MQPVVLNRILRGLGANVYGQGVVILIQLVGVPILLYYWGTRLYGEWLILFAIPSYLSRTDLGFSISAANDMSAQVSRGDRAGARAVYQSLAALVFSIALLGLLAVSALVAVAPLREWLHLSALSDREARWVLGLLAASVMVKLMDGVNHAGFRANGDYPLHVTIHLTGLLFQNLGVWAAAALGYGPLGAAVAYLLVPLVEVPAAGLWLSKRHGWLSIGLRHAELSQLRRLFRPALANFAMPLSQAINVQGMILVVGATLGPVAVVVFSTLRTLTRMVVRMVTSVSEATEPELAFAWGADDRTLIAQLYVHSLRAGLWASLAAMLGLFLGGRWILAVWTHGKVIMDVTLFHWLLATALASVLWNGSVTLLKAANQHLRAAVWYVVTSAAAVGLAAVLLHVTANLAYAGVALLLMDLSMAVYAVYTADALTGIGIGTMLRRVASPLPLVGLLVRGKHVY